MSGAPYGVGDEDDVEDTLGRLQVRIADVKEEMSRLRAHLNADEEMDRERVRDRLGFMAYWLRKAANEVDPGP
jgi:uncharacterized protein YicC (UPF0701 family)